MKVRLGQDYDSHVKPRITSEAGRWEGWRRGGIMDTPGPKVLYIYMIDLLDLSIAGMNVNIVTLKMYDCTARLCRARLRLRLRRKVECGCYLRYRPLGVATRAIHPRSF